MRLRYGTRGSALALAQSAWVAERLKEAGAVETERTIIHTSGDRFSAQQPPDAPSGPAENVKAMFVKEIEEALLKGEIDFAVHSAKDLPAALPEGLTIAAYPAREDPRDVYIGSAECPAWESSGRSKPVGTSSLRRRIQLGLSNPQASFAPLRGNVDTRLRRLAAGEFSGIVLARAGLRRLGLSATRQQLLPVELLVPAPGQGALAIEARAEEPELLAALGVLEHRETRLAVECERALLEELGAGCQTPLGVLAEVQGRSTHLNVFWADEKGGRPIRRSETVETAAALEFARALAQELRNA